MKQLGRSVRKTVKQGNAIPATVTDIQADRVTVRLSGNGTLYKNLPLVGGPVVRGQTVKVDFTTEIPTVVAPGQTVDIPAAARTVHRAQFRTLPSTPVATQRPAGEVIWVTDETGTIQGSAAGYPVTIDGLNSACAAITIGKGWTIWIPKGTITGNVTFPDYTRVVGVGPQQTLLVGLIATGDGFSFQDIGFGLEGTYNVGGVVLNVELGGDGNFSNCRWNTVNTGSTVPICLGNQLYASEFTLDNCTFVNSTGFGIALNFIRDGYGGNVNFWRFMGWQAFVAQPDWFVQIDTDPNWMHFKDPNLVFDAGQKIIDGFIMILNANKYAKEGAQVWLEFETDKAGTTSIDVLPYSSPINCYRGLWIEDPTILNDWFASTIDTSTMVPPLPSEDNSAVEYVNRATTWDYIHRGDKVGWRLDNMAFGLGSDYEGYAPGSQVPFTISNQSPYKSVYLLLSRGMGNVNTEPRYYQDGYEFWMKLSRAYIQLPDNTKRWIAPTVSKGHLHSTTFNCNESISAGPFSTILADSFTMAILQNYTGTVLPEDSEGKVTVSPEQPANSWPGAMWYDTNP